jgi:hypothetical protein
VKVVEVGFSIQILAKMPFRKMASFPVSSFSSGKQSYNIEFTTAIVFVFTLFKRPMKSGVFNVTLKTPKQRMENGQKHSVFLLRKYMKISKRLIKHIL